MDMAADVSGLTLCGQGLVAASSIRKQQRVNQIMCCNGLSQPKLPREKFGVSSDESKTKPRRGRRSGRRSSKHPSSARRFLHPMPENPTTSSPSKTIPPPSLLSHSQHVTSATSQVELAHAGPPTRHEDSVLANSNKNDNDGHLVRQEDSGSRGSDDDAQVDPRDEGPASSYSPDGGVKPQPASAPEFDTPQARQNPLQTSTSCSLRIARGGQTSVSLWDEANACLAIKKPSLTCAPPNPAETPSALSMATEDAVKPQDRIPVTETKREAATCRKDDLRHGGGAKGVIMISHTVLKIQPEARPARLRCPTRNRHPTRTPTKTQTQDALDAASEQSELERVRAMKRIEDFKKMEDRRRENALKQQEDLRRKRAVERKAKEHEMERQRAEIYALNAIMSESELSQVEIYRKQIEKDTSTSSRSFGESGEALNGNVVGKSKMHAV